MSLKGIHHSNISELLNINKKHNISFFQIFIKSKDLLDTTNSSPIKYEIKNNIQYKLHKKNIKLICHGSYSVNLSRNWEESDWMIQRIIQEIKIADKLGSFGLVIHVGKQLNLTKPKALNNMYTSLIYIAEQTKQYDNVRILIETPAGQGTETLTNTKDFCSFMNKFFTHPKKYIQKRFGICIDTCHIFVSGIDITNKKEVVKYFTTIKKMIGLDKIKLGHINDSKGKHLSKLDRHENIGYGEIGNKPILNIVKFFDKLKIPMILETPHEKILDDYKMITK
jgi:deoxyribonuclease-4